MGKMVDIYRTCSNCVVWFPVRVSDEKADEKMKIHESVNQTVELISQPEISKPNRPERRCENPEQNSEQPKPGFVLKRLDLDSKIFFISLIGPKKNYL